MSCWKKEGGRKSRIINQISDGRWGVWGIVDVGESLTRLLLLLGDIDKERLVRGGGVGGGGLNRRDDIFCWR